MPIPTPTIDLTAELDRVRRAFADAGRDPGSVHTVVMNGPTNRGELERFAELGIQGAALTVWAQDHGDVLATLDGFTELL